MKARLPRKREQSSEIQSWAYSVRPHCWSRLVPTCVVAGLFLGWMMWPLPATGQDCIDYGDYLHWVGNVDMRDAARGVAVAGNYAYVADGWSGLQVIDVSNPASPMIVGGVDTYYAYGVAVAGSYAYVADLEPGLKIYPSQCEVPTAVALSAFHATPVPGAILLTWSTPYEVDHLGFHLQRSTRADDGYTQMNAALIGPPAPYRFLDTGVRPGTTYFYRLEAVVRSGGSEFYGPVMATAGAAPASRRYALEQSRPNPFLLASGSTEIAFELGERAHATLRVFDVAGRVIRLLLDEPMDAGPHAVWWDGRSEGGSEAASGIYFYRLEAGPFTEVRTLVKLR